MKNFADYLNEVDRVYQYTIKVAAPEFNAAHMEKVKSCLAKYDVKDISDVRKTPLQKNPIDFPNVTNMEVFIFDVKMKYPATIEMLHTHICDGLGLPKAMMVVYSENDPRHAYTEAWIERNTQEYRDAYKAIIGTAPEEVFNEELYPQKIVDELIKKAKERVKKAKTYKTPLTNGDIEIPGYYNQEKSSSPFTNIERD